MFKALIEERLRGLKEYVDEAIEHIDLSSLHPLMEAPIRYMLKTGGKRLRPLICLLSAELVGGDRRRAVKPFLALELIHNGTLIHDDIIDEDLTRRGKPSIHIAYGVKRGILAGDILLSLGLRYASETGDPRVVRWLSETSSKMVQGVALQTHYRRRLTSEETYLEIAYLKSGSLFEASAALGALVGGGVEGEVEQLAAFGRDFGVAYQIRDDVHGILTGEEALNDLVNGDVTLPLIYALKSPWRRGRGSCSWRPMRGAPPWRRRR
ncbi:MAG: bifunctional short chain isoprenyl diphosphate synthase [Candidatus Bathyarchaeota archaeon B23]|nr:MAG: bifunctional short chain isoprenyl diphosphate synthase [Candidatus Bathyarchaeota archaeon B23]